MHCPSNCAAVIPCYNEAAAIATVVMQVRAIVSSVFVVDDGSQDNTAAIAAAAGAKVISRAQNEGKGVAINKGLGTALREGFTWAVLLDGDGQHATGDLPQFFKTAELTGARLVIGNRMSQPRGMPWLRRFVNRWMSLRLSRRAGQSLPDTQCGFRLVHLPSWAELSLSTRRFEVESEMLLAFLEAGLRVEFVPIQVIYTGSRSRIHPVGDTFRWFRWWFSGRATPPSSTRCVRAGVEV